MTGPYEVYLRDGHGVLTKLTGRYAAEVMADFWDNERTHHGARMKKTVVVDDLTGEIYKQTLTTREVAEIEAGIRNLSLLGNYSTITLDNGQMYRIERIWPDLGDEDQ